MKYFLAGLGLADLGGEGAALAAGAVADVAAALEVAARVGRAQRDVLEDLARALGGPVFIDLDVNPKAAGAAAAIDASRAFAAPGGPVVVRVPFDDEGRAAIRAGAAAGLIMGAVGCATPTQALEAAEAGAAWTSPAVGVPPRGAALDELLQVLRKDPDRRGVRGRARRVGACRAVTPDRAAPGGGRLTCRASASTSTR
jgi:hypothetical protein